MKVLINARQLQTSLIIWYPIHMYAFMPAAECSVEYPQENNYNCKLFLLYTHLLAIYCCTAYTQAGIKKVTLKQHAYINFLS